MGQTFSPEMSFVPKEAPHEIRNKREGDALVKRILRWMYVTEGMGPLGRLLYAKIDPFHNPWDKRHRTYSIEICPRDYFDTNWLDNGQWPTLRKGLKKMWRGLRKEFGLVPTLVEKDRKGNETHWPGGGCHIHMGADIFMQGPFWYRKAERFHRNLITDYANRPWIKWLFSQWFADESNYVPVNATELADGWWSELGHEQVRQPTPDILFEQSFDQRGIEPRYMCSGKDSYLTFEFRMVSMVESPEELRAAVRFLKRWMNHVRCEGGKHSFDNGNSATIPFSLTQDNLKDMSDLDKSWGIVVDFLKQLDLDCTEYRSFFERNYSNRIRFGKMI